ncbi:hypothetical protein ACJMK2_010413 [Sinanodonta woodiana]|uniref:TIR domain-containing protein n=1 Tax=Sinanodonta woodiana TaxID=1069815 RepID=A0ABD3VFA3_SINWO
MEKSENSCSIILWTYVLFLSVSIVHISFSCPIGCSCFRESGSLLACVKCVFVAENPDTYKLFPFVLPINTAVVQLQHVVAQDAIAPDLFTRVSFVDLSWHDVQQITINSDSFDSYQVSALSNNSLRGLDLLKVLRVHQEIGSLESGVFLNTPNIETLDLSDNLSLRMVDVIRALRYALPKLKYLDVSRIQRVSGEPLILGREFTEAIRNKPLEVLNISGTTLVSLDDDFNYPSIQVFNLSHNSLLWIPRSPTIDLLPKLREIDISYSSIPVFADMPHTQPFRNPNQCLHCLESSLKCIYAHDIIRRFPIKVIDAFYSIPCESSVIELIDISNINIRWLNVSINLVLLNLQVFIASRNSLGYISPKLLQSFPNLRQLHLERNNLSTMQYFPDFEDIISNNHALESLDLSWNSLSFLPRKIFVSVAALKELKLQGNSIVYFDVEIRDLYHLRILDLSENGLTLISSQVIQELDTIYKRRLNITTLGNTSSTNNSLTSYTRCSGTAFHVQERNDLVINLQGNKFDCSCEHIPFLTWITESQIYFEGKFRHNCGQGFYIQELDKGSVNNLVHSCNHQRRHLVIIVPVIIGGLIIVFVVLIGRCIYRRTLLGQKRKNHDNKHEVQVEDFVPTKYRAFLSFCAMDEDVVKIYFYPIFSRALEEYFGEKDILAFGETCMIPGRKIDLEIERCFSQSDVIIFIVTLDFVKNYWCKFELDHAEHLGKPTIYLVENMVLKQKIPSCLRELKFHTRATWRREENAIKMTPDWEVITRQIIDIATAVRR